MTTTGCSWSSSLPCPLLWASRQRSSRGCWRSPSHLRLSRAGPSGPACGQHGAPPACVAASLHSSSVHVEPACPCASSYAVRSPPLPVSITQPARSLCFAFRSRIRSPLHPVRALLPSCLSVAYPSTSVLPLTLGTGCEPAPRRHYAAHVRSHFVTNLAVSGGLLLLQGFGAGRYTVDEMLKKKDS